MKKIKKKKFTFALQPIEHFFSFRSSILIIWNRQTTSSVNGNPKIGEFTFIKIYGEEPLNRTKFCKAEIKPILEKWSEENAYGTASVFKIFKFG